MKFSSAVAVVGALASTATAQRPTDTSICDYYTTALLKENNATNQYTLLTLLVNTVAIGNYTQPNKNAVAGILAPGMYGGEMVSLAKYFTGALNSTNRNGMGVSVNFLDGGGATPLKANMLPEASSNQFKLVTHLYQYFGALLGCSTYGQMGFPAYQGAASQYEVHRYMNLNQNEMGYFIEQVGLAAASFGVADSDVAAVGMSLNNTFNFRCSPKVAVIPAQGAQFQAMCSNPSCPLSPNATCGAYPNNGLGTEPVNITMISTTTAPVVGTTPTPTKSMPAGFTGAAATVAANAGAVIGGAIALAMAL